MRTAYFQDSGYTNTLFPRLRLYHNYDYGPTNGAQQQMAGIPHINTRLLGRWWLKVDLKKNSKRRPLYSFKIRRWSGANFLKFRFSFVSAGRNITHDGVPRRLSWVSRPRLGRQRPVANGAKELTFWSRANQQEQTSASDKRTYNEPTSQQLVMLQKKRT